MSGISIMHYTSKTTDAVEKRVSWRRRLPLLIRGIFLLRCILSSWLYLQNSCHVIYGAHDAFSCGPFLGIFQAHITPRMKNK